MHGETVKPA